MESSLAIQGNSRSLSCASEKQNPNSLQTVRIDASKACTTKRCTHRPRPFGRLPFNHIDSSMQGFEVARRIMPNYQNPAYFRQNSSTEFTQVYHPGKITPNSGIYRCISCGFEATCVSGRTLPPESNCQNHSPKWRAAWGTVQWQLVAAAIHASA